MQNMLDLAFVLTIKYATIKSKINQKNDKKTVGEAL